MHQIFCRLVVLLAIGQRSAIYWIWDWEWEEFGINLQQIIIRQSTGKIFKESEALEEIVWTAWFFSLKVWNVFFFGIGKIKFVSSDSDSSDHFFRTREETLLYSDNLSRHIYAKLIITFTSACYIEFFL